MIDDARYAYDDFADEEAPQTVDERIALAKAAIAIEHQMVDKASALRLVLNRAHDDAVSALIGLIDADPTDSKAIRDLQWEVGRYHAMCTYINEVLSDGADAESALTAEQNDRLRAVAENMLHSEQVGDIDD